MKKSSDILIGIVAVIFFAGFGIVQFVLPDREMSELENRTLQQAPRFTGERFFSGQWGGEIEEYLIDQFPLREFWVGSKALSEVFLFGKKELHDIYLGSDSRLLPKTEGPASVFERNLNALQSIIDRSGLPVTVMMPPTATTVLSGSLPANAPYYNEVGTIDRVSGHIGENRVIDLSEAMSRASESETLYFKTDHHWTMRGAYEAYAAYIRACGMTPLPLEEFRVETVSGAFHGTSYAKAGLWGIRAEPIDLLVPPGGYTATLDGGSMFVDEQLERFDKYAYFLGGNQPLHVIENPDAGTGRVLVVIKDSYAHILAPMLSLHFDTVLLMDPRYINVDPYEIMAPYEPTDLLVLMNANNMGHENGLTLFLRY